MQAEGAETRSKTRDARGKPRREVKPRRETEAGMRREARRDARCKPSNESQDAKREARDASHMRGQWEIQPKQFVCVTIPVVTLRSEVT